MENYKTINVDAKSNKIKVIIDKDENRYIFINPGDAEERVRYYTLFEELKAAEKNLNVKEKKLEEGKEIKKLFEFEIEIFDTLAKLFDETFGKGTVGKITNGIKEIDMLSNFAAGIAPCFSEYSTKQIEKYTKYQKIANDTGILE